VKKKIQELEKHIERLQKRRYALENDLYEAQRSLAKVQSALKRLQTEEDQDLQQEEAKKTWLAYFLGPRESEEAKEARGRRATERRTGRIVREAERDRYKTTVNSFEITLRQVDTEISNTRLTKDLEERREELRQGRLQRERREAEQRRRENEAERARQKAREDSEKLRKERQAREAQVREAQAREAQAREAQAREAQAREAQAREAQARKAHEQECKASAETRKVEDIWKRRQETPIGRTNRPRSQRPQAAGQTTTKACIHRGWWTKVEGRYQCQCCLVTTVHFAFACPGCSKIACAGCRNVLKNGR
jgi:hypothetical protein